MRRGLLAPVLAMLILLVSAAAAQAATITVTATDDPAGAGDCLGADTSCSLRQAINAENGTPAGGDTIALGAHTYSLTQGSDIIATKPFDLQGVGVGSTTIGGSANSGTNQYGSLARILRVDSGATLVIQGITFTGGYDEEDENCSSGCNTINANGGGDLFNNGGQVTLDGVAFSNNYSSATPLGGAVSNGSGSLTMNDVSFAHNAAGVGGALFTRGGTVNGYGVTFSDNTTTCCGGGTAYLLGGTISLVNSTITRSGGYTGAITNGGASLTLDNVTMSDNGADIQTDTSGSTTVENTIIGTGSGGSACVAPGRSDDLNNQTTGSAITNDVGNNIAQDNSCGLNATGDLASVDPKLVPLFDNGGPTQTQALLAGSPALGDPATANCPATDQRGVSRPDGSCDIGAFEAVLIDAPGTPTTGAAQNLTSRSADLTATINLNDEAGGFHFLYGTSTDPATWTSSPEAPAGIVSGDPPRTETETLSDLTPGTTYYYEAVADNASGSTQAAPGDVRQFTTLPEQAQVSEVSVESTTDTTAKIDFTIDPEGADTKYVVKYGQDTNYAQQTAPVDIGSTAGGQDLSAFLSALTPGTTYHYEIVATNSEGPTDSGDNTFDTAPQATGTVGQPVSITDTGAAYGCPSPPTVDWGDQSADDQAQIACMEGQDDATDYTVSDSHTYTKAGHYLIEINYGEGGVTDQYAQISPASGPPPSPPSTPSSTPTRPSVSGGAPTTKSRTGASVSGTVNPQGGATQAYFQYGLDLSQRGPGASTTLYDHATPPQSVGSDSASHSVSASLTGLIPGALYHVRLVATNAAGTTFGLDQTFTAAKAAAPPPPVVGHSEDAKPITGTVFIKNALGQFVPLTGAIQVKTGTVIDALHGSLHLIAALGKGKTNQGTFGGAVFRLTQARNGLTTLTLIEGAFKGAPSYALCRAHAAPDPAATTARSRTLQLLRASAHGKFRTKGRYSAATVRGTSWTIADRCDGTLTHDITHSVAVADFVRHRTIILHAGQSYLAKAHKP